LLPSWICREIQLSAELKAQHLSQRVRPILSTQSSEVVASRGCELSQELSCAAGLTKGSRGCGQYINKKGMKRRKSFIRCAPQQLVTEVNSTL
jgi:hypothetical protein